MNLIYYRVSVDERGKNDNGVKLRWIHFLPQSDQN